MQSDGDLTEHAFNGYFLYFKNKILFFIFLCLLLLVSIVSNVMHHFLCGTLLVIVVFVNGIIAHTKFIFRLLNLCL